jgi:hypothetical protein
MGSGGTPTYGFSGAPYALTPVLSGSVAFWNGSSWAQAGLGTGNTPSCIGLDASGGAWVGTAQNTYWHLASGGAVLSSGQVATYFGQQQSVPLCLSAVLANASGTYFATSVPGLIVQAA